MRQLAFAAALLAFGLVLEVGALRSSRRWGLEHLAPSALGIENRGLFQYQRGLFAIRTLSVDGPSLQALDEDLRSRGWEPLSAHGFGPWYSAGDRAALIERSYPGGPIKVTEYTRVSRTEARLMQWTGKWDAPRRPTKTAWYPPRYEPPPPP